MVGGELLQTHIQDISANQLALHFNPSPANVENMVSY
jgi:hypothetical protein